MAPCIRRLQTSYEKHQCAPLSRKKDRHTHKERMPITPSPLVFCSDVGIVFNSECRKDEAYPKPYGFLPIRHSTYELIQEKEMNLKRKKMSRDMQKVDKLLSIDILLNSLRQRAENREKPPEPIPIRIKVSPQIRRLRIKRDKPEVRSKMKLPERGQLIPKSPGAPTIRNILTMKYPKVKPDTKEVATTLLTRLLGDEVTSPAVHQIIAHRRSCLYREENICWSHLFVPMDEKNRSNMSPVFKLFDNTDEGIPVRLLLGRDEYNVLTSYQFRVLSKRFAIGGNHDFEERFLLAEILGLQEEQVHRVLLKMKYEQEVRTKSEKELRLHVENTFTAVVNAFKVDSEDVGDLLHTYEHVMIPILDELFAH